MQPANKLLFGLLLLVGATASGAVDKTAAPPDSTAMMAQMQKYGMPGPGHQILQQAVGHWSHTVHMWMKPGDKPQESLGTSENTLVLGGRFLKQEAHGTVMGQPYEGIGYTGYDNIRAEYQSVWMDNMATGMMIGAGTYNAASKTLSEAGQMSCPMTAEKAMPYRTEWKIVDNDNQVYSMYAKGPDGKEMKSMEILYKRVK